MIFAWLINPLYKIVPNPIEAGLKVLLFLYTIIIIQPNIHSLSVFLYLKTIRDQFIDNRNIQEFALIRAVLFQNIVYQFMI